MSRVDEENSGNEDVVPMIRYSYKGSGSRVSDLVPGSVHSRGRTFTEEVGDHLHGVYSYVLHQINMDDLGRVYRLHTCFPY